MAVARIDPFGALWLLTSIDPDRAPIGGSASVPREFRGHLV